MMLPTIEDMQRMADGWAGLEYLEKQARGQVKADHDDPRARLAAQVHQALTTPHGRALLEHLLDRTVRRPAVPDMSNLNVTGLSLEGLTAQVVWHQAQTALVRELIALMSEGAAGTPADNA